LPRPGAEAALDELVAAHGGEDAWGRRDEIRARVKSGGFALASKLARGRFRDYEIAVDVERPRSVLAPYPRTGQRGVFEDGRVRIESVDGEVLAERADPRRAFRPFSRRALWWDPLDSLYFAGYAMWNYLTTPVLLRGADVDVREGEPWQEEPGARWRRLHATFPPTVPTHSREQTFYLDDGGRVRRHDYTAEVFGSWASAAHYSWDHAEIDGVVLPTRRRVVPRARSNRPRPGPTLVSIELSPAR
jgi:hypothetical protein